MKRTAILFGGPLAGKELQVDEKALNHGEIRFPEQSQIDVTKFGETPETIETIRYHKYQLKGQLHPRWHMVDKPMFMYQYVGEVGTLDERLEQRERYLDALDDIREKRHSEEARMLDEDDAIPTRNNV